MKNLPCTKRDCMYLHEVGDKQNSFTKEEMAVRKHISAPPDKKKSAEDMQARPQITDAVSTSAASYEEIKSREETAEPCSLESASRVSPNSQLPVFAKEPSGEMYVRELEACSIVKDDRIFELPRK